MAALGVGEEAVISKGAPLNRPKAGKAVMQPLLDANIRWKVGELTRQVLVPTVKESEEHFLLTGLSHSSLSLLPSPTELSEACGRPPGDRVFPPSQAHDHNNRPYRCPPSPLSSAIRSWARAGSPTEHEPAPRVTHTVSQDNDLTAPSPAAQLRLAGHRSTLKHCTGTEVEGDPSPFLHAFCSF